LLLKKVMLFVVVVSSTLDPVAVLHRPDPPRLMVKRKQDEVCGMTLKDDQSEPGGPIMLLLLLLLL
jgi:hypothetical protein